MNIPLKVMRSTYIAYDTYNHHQQLAKRFYKHLHKPVKKASKEETESIGSFVLCDLKQNFKEELLKW